MSTELLLEGPIIEVTFTTQDGWPVTVEALARDTVLRHHQSLSCRLCRSRIHETYRSGSECKQVSKRKHSC